MGLNVNIGAVHRRACHIMHVRLQQSKYSDLRPLHEQRMLLSHANLTNLRRGAEADFEALKKVLASKGAPGSRIEALKLAGDVANKLFLYLAAAGYLDCEP